MDATDGDLETTYVHPEEVKSLKCAIDGVVLNNYQQTFSFILTSDR